MKLYTTPFQNSTPEEQFAQPVSAPEPAVKIPSSTELFLKSAKQNVGRAIVSIPGMMAGAKLGTMGGSAVAGPIGGGVGGFVGGLGGAIGGGMIGDELQKMIDPTYENDAEILAQNYDKNKWAVNLGALAPNLAAFGPSLAPLKQLATIPATVRATQAGGKALSAGGRFSQLNADQIGAMANVGAGVGMGVAPTVQSLVNDQPIDIPQLLTGLAAGALITQPHKFMGSPKLGPLAMHKSPAPGERPINDIYNNWAQLTEEQQQQVLKERVPTKEEKIAANKAKAFGINRLKDIEELTQVRVLEGVPESIARQQVVDELYNDAYATFDPVANKSPEPAKRPPLKKGEAAKIMKGLEEQRASDESPTAMQYDPDSIFTRREDEVAAKMENRQKPENIKLLDELFARFAGRERFSKVEPTKDLGSAGLFTPRKDATEPSNIKLNYAGEHRSGIDTAPHEIAHEFENFLARSPREVDNQLNKLRLDATANDPEYLRWKAAREKESAATGTPRDTSPEEFLARETGAMMTLRMEESPKTRQKNDEIAAKALRDGTITLDHLLRYTAATLSDGPSFHQVVGSHGKFDGAKVSNAALAGGALTQDESPSGKKRFDFKAAGALKPYEGTPGTIENPPVPETRSALQTQLDLTALENSSKAATLLPPGSPIPNDIPSSLELTKTPHGVVIYNPKKTTYEAVVRAGAEDVFDGRLLGMANGPVKVQSDKAVVTSYKGVQQVLAEVVAPGMEDAAIAAHQRAVPGGESKIVPISEIAGERASVEAPATTAKTPWKFTADELIISSDATRGVQAEFESQNPGMKLSRGAAVKRIQDKFIADKGIQAGDPVDPSMPTWIQAAAKGGSERTLRNRRVEGTTVEEKPVQARGYAPRTYHGNVEPSAFDQTTTDLLTRTAKTRIIGENKMEEISADDVQSLTLESVEAIRSGKWNVDKENYPAFKAYTAAEKVIGKFKPGTEMHAEAKAQMDNNRAGYEAFQKAAKDAIYDIAVNRLHTAQAAVKPDMPTVPIEAVGQIDTEGRVYTESASTADAVAASEQGGGLAINELPTVTQGKKPTVDVRVTPALSDAVYATEVALGRNPGQNKNINQFIKLLVEDADTHSSYFKALDERIQELQDYESSPEFALRPAGEEAKLSSLVEARDKLEYEIAAVDAKRNLDAPDDMYALVRELTPSTFTEKFGRYKVGDKVPEHEMNRRVDHIYNDAQALASFIETTKRAGPEYYDRMKEIVMDRKLTELELAKRKQQDMGMNIPPHGFFKGEVRELQGAEASASAIKLAEELAKKERTTLEPGSIKETPTKVDDLREPTPQEVKQTMIYLDEAFNKAREFQREIDALSQKGIEQTDLVKSRIDNVIVRRDTFFKEQGLKPPTDVFAKSMDATPTSDRAMRFSDKSPSPNEKKLADLFKDEYIDKRVHFKNISVDPAAIISKEGRQPLGQYHHMSSPAATRGEGFTRDPEQFAIATHEAGHRFIDKYASLIKNIITRRSQLGLISSNDVFELAYASPYQKHENAVMSQFTQPASETKTGVILDALDELIASHVGKHDKANPEFVTALISRFLGKDFAALTDRVRANADGEWAKGGEKQGARYRSDESANPRSIVPDFLRSEVDKVTDIDPKVGAALNDMFRIQSRLAGKFGFDPIHRIIQKLALKSEGRSYTQWANDLWTQDSPELREVVQYRNDQMDGKATTPLSKKAAEINKIVDEIMDLTATELQSRESLKHDTKPATPGYLPHVLSREASSVLSKRTDQAAVNKIHKEIVDFNISQGKTRVEAEKMWKTLADAYAGENMGDKAARFGPVDRLEGIGLPESVRENNLLDILSRFTNRYAKRLAWEDAIVQNKYAKDKLTNSDTGIGANPHVRNVMDEINGRRDYDETTRNAMLGVMRAGMMMTRTGVADFISNFTLGMQYMDAGQIVPAATSALKNLKQNVNDAFKFGVSRENLANLEINIDAKDQFSNILKRGRDIINKTSGRQWLEQVTRGVAFGQGKWLATDALMAKKNGTLTSQQKSILEKFVPKDGTLNDATINEAAARYVEAVQGTYDYRGLPAIAQKGSLAPFLSLARWNIEKLNNFDKHVIQPAQQGNIKPLLMATLGMIAGGTAVEKMTEMLMGRKSRLPQWNEIANSEEWADGLLYRFAGLASLSGFAGMYGDMTKVGMDIAFKNQPQSYTNPLVEGVMQGSALGAQYVQALMDGNGIQAAKVFEEFLYAYFQNARAVANHTWKSEAVDKQEKLRDLKMFKNLNNMEVPAASKTSPNPFMDSDSREFKRTRSLEDAAQMLPGLLERAIEKAGQDPERLKEELRSLKINSYPTMPSPDNMPSAFVRYITYLEQTEGKEEATRRLTDYITQNAINKAKSQMIP